MQASSKIRLLFWCAYQYILHSSEAFKLLRTSHVFALSAVKNRMAIPSLWVWQQPILGHGAIFELEKEKYEFTLEMRLKNNWMLDC